MKKNLFTLSVILLLAAGCKPSQQASVQTVAPTTKTTEQKLNPASTSTLETQKINSNSTSTASQADKKKTTIVANNSNAVCPEPSTSQYLAENVNQARLVPQIYANDILALSAAKTFLINRLGQNAYNCDLTLALNLGVGPQNTYDPNEHNYRVEYVFKPQGISNISSEVRIIVDTSNGQATMVPDGYLGVPDCANSPEKCEIKINGQQAVAVATQAGATSSGLPVFYYDGTYDTFAWMVDEGTPCPYKTFNIDATSGVILSQTANRCVPPPSH